MAMEKDAGRTLHYAEPGTHQFLCTSSGAAGNLALDAWSWTECADAVTCPACKAMLARQQRSSTAVAG